MAEQRNAPPVRAPDEIEDPETRPRPPRPADPNDYDDRQERSEDGSRRYRRRPLSW